jgi:hypothetical protein
MKDATHCDKTVIMQPHATRDVYWKDGELDGSINAALAGLPTAAPTPAPTPAPLTPAPTTPTPGTPGTQSQSLQAVGDPHLVNMHGERFDIFQEGTHVLLLIPKGAVETAFLNVMAEAWRSGSACSDLYFKTVNVTGKWVEEIHEGGLQYFASRPSSDTSNPWMHFRSVDLKVRWGHTGDGIKYLNLFVRHLGKAGYPVGGLLGEDDHRAIATRTEGCLKSVSLMQTPYQQEAMAEADLM